MIYLHFCPTHWRGALIAARMWEPWAYLMRTGRHG